MRLTVVACELFILLIFLMVAKSMLPTFMRRISWLCFVCWGWGIMGVGVPFYEVLIWLMAEGEALTVFPLK